MQCNCGSQNFELNEGIVWEGYSNSNKVLEVEKSQTSSIENILCASCGKEYSLSSFEEINFG